MLQIKNLSTTIEGKRILNGVNFSVKPGEIHAVMGPNGTGKSTLAYTIAGHPKYHVESGDIVLNKHSLLSLSPDKRAKLGLFLAFQYPVEISGVSVQNMLRTAYEARFSAVDSVLKFREQIAVVARALNIKEELVTRSLNEGFSGGEKKRVEVLQMMILKPTYAILDETDSGLDIDSVQVVAAGVKQAVKQFKTGAIVITHYQRILKYLKPDVVHVMVGGKIVESGGPALAKKLEKKGYAEYV